VATSLAIEAERVEEIRRSSRCSRRCWTNGFPNDALGKESPYGVYDVNRNESWISIALCRSVCGQAIRAWWRPMGGAAYPEADELLIVADADESNTYIVHASTACLRSPWSAARHRTAAPGSTRPKG
jgi:hypothetical protein